MYDFDLDAVRDVLNDICAPDVVFRLAYPFESTSGVDAYLDKSYAPLLMALPDLERRDHIVMAGSTPEGADWVGCGGTYVGSFAGPWLDIPPTGHIVHMRFHEFYRIQNGKIVEMQALWDIPEVMMQAGAWPMAPRSGGNGMCRGLRPVTGLCRGPHDAEAGEPSSAHISTCWSTDATSVAGRARSDGDAAVLASEDDAGTGLPVSARARDRGVSQLAPDSVSELPCRIVASDGKKSRSILLAIAITPRDGLARHVQTITHGGWLGIALREQGSNAQP